MYEDLALKQANYEFFSVTIRFLKGYFGKGWRGLINPIGHIISIEVPQKAAMVFLHQIPCRSQSYYRFSVGSWKQNINKK